MLFSDNAALLASDQIREESTVGVISERKQTNIDFKRRKGAGVKSANEQTLRVHLRLKLEPYQCRTPISISALDHVMRKTIWRSMKSFRTSEKSP